MSDRPSDAMQPHSKRRAGEQLRKEDVDDDYEEDGDPGTWQPTGKTIEGRKRVRVRRHEGSHPIAVAGTGSEDQPAATANPFAGISLSTAAAAPNPFAGVSLMQPASGFGALAPKAAEAPAPTTTTESPGDKAEAASTTEGAEPAAAAAPTSTSTSIFGSLGGGNAFAGLANTGKAFGSTGFTFGGPNAFGSGTTVAFSFPKFGASAPKAGGEGEEEGEEEGGEGVAMFGEPDAHVKPVVSLPEVKSVTGEEDEENVFKGEPANLYEFDASTNKWMGRGVGEFRINTSRAGGGPRMVMRQANTGRLLLNAKVWKDMPCNKMAGDVGVTFACANCAVPAEAKAGDKDKEGGQAEEAAPAKLATWAVRIKRKDLVEQCFSVLCDCKNRVGPADS